MIHNFLLGPDNQREKPEHPDKPERPEKPDKPELPEAPERPEYPERPEPEEPDREDPDYVGRDTPKSCKPGDQKCEDRRRNGMFLCVCFCLHISSLCFFLKI